VVETRNLSATQLVHVFLELLEVFWANIADIGAKTRFAMVVPMDLVVDGCWVAGYCVEVWYRSGD
jgi:hypothetical protein